MRWFNFTEKLHADAQSYTTDLSTINAAITSNNTLYGNLIDKPHKTNNLNNCDVIGSYK